jgi:hypothetical protein
MLSSTPESCSLLGVKVTILDKMSYAGTSQNFKVDANANVYFEKYTFNFWNKSTLVMCRGHPFKC